MLGKAIFEHLSSKPAIKSLVQARIFPVLVPQNVQFPCITYQLISDPRLQTLEGVSVPNPYVQIDCWAKTYNDAHALAAAVETALECYRGLMGGLVQVHSCLLRSKADIFEPEVNDFRVSLDFSIWHT